MRDTDALGTVARNGLAMQAGIGEVIERRGLPHVFTGVPAMFGVMFTEQLPADYRGWAATDQSAAALRRTLGVSILQDVLHSAEGG